MFSSVGLRVEDVFGWVSRWFLVFSLIFSSLSLVLLGFPLATPLKRFWWQLANEQRTASTSKHPGRHCLELLGRGDGGHLQRNLQFILQALLGFA